MTRITNSDKIAIILAAKLKSSKSENKNRTSVEPINDAFVTVPKPEIFIADLGEEELERIEEQLVFAILKEEFGPSMSQDARFSDLAKETLARLKENPDAGKLLRQTLEKVLS